MIPQDLHYLHPSAVYLIPLAFLILLLLVGLKLYRSKMLERYASAAHLTSLLRSESDWIFWLRTSAFTLSWIFACIALMQPVGNGKELTGMGLTSPDSMMKKRKLHDVIFVVDASASMGIKDGRNATSRLDQAKEIADQILQKLDGHQAALYAFTTDSIQLSPSTFNLFYVRGLVDGITLREGGSSGTDLKIVFESIHEKYIAKPRSKLRTIILLSDGGDTRIESLDGSRKSEAVQELAALVKDAHTRLFTVGVGTPKGAAVPNVFQNGEPVVENLKSDVLQTLADSARGKFYPAYEVSINDIAEDILRIINQDNPFLSQGENFSSSQASVIYTQYYQIPLVICIVLLLIGLFFPVQFNLRALVLIAFIPAIIHADDLDQASQWYQAGAYKRAIDIYREMMVNPLSDWEEMVVRYNTGTALAAEAEWTSAIGAFRSLPITNNPSPWLQRLTQTNMAITSLREAISVQDLTRQIFALRRTLVYISNAREWDCKTKKIIGYEKCPVPGDLDHLQAIAENRLSNALIYVNRYRIDHAGFLNGIPLLLSQVEAMLQNIKFLRENVKGSSLKKEYQKVFVYEAESWLPLWEQLKKRADPPPSFLAARKNYIYSQLLLRDNDFTGAENYLTDTAKQLKEVMKVEFAAVKEMDLLQNLQQSYQHVLVQDPIQMVNLIGLYHEQQEIIRQIGHPLGDASKALVQALKFLGEGKQKGTQIQVEISFDAVRKYTWEQSDDLTTISILEAAIASQEHALNIALLNTLEIEQQENAQKQVLETAAPFIQRVIAEQQDAYKQNGICLEKPWDTVVPKYYNGLQAARTALISVNPIKWQEQALAYWQEALNELKAEKVEELQEENSMNQLFEELQQMDQMDQSPKTPPQPSTGEAKPW